MTTAGEQLQQSVAGLVYLIELQFTTGTVRLCSWGHPLEWMGYGWQGFGAVVSVSATQDTEGLQYPAVDLGLAIQDPSMLAMARSDVKVYRRRPVRIWIGVMSEDLQQLETPELVWSGQMDQIRIKTGDPAKKDASMAILRCELHGRDRRAPQSLRLNQAQHQARYPGDTGLSRVEALTGKPVPWLSVRFQRQE